MALTPTRRTVVTPAMKTSSLALVILTVLVGLTICVTVDGATPPGGKKANELVKKQPAVAKQTPGLVRQSKTESFLANLSVSPVVVIRSADVGGDSDLGAGLDIGYEVNKFVSVHVVNLTYEDHNWHTGAIDDTAFNVEAKLSKFSTEKFTPYAIGGAVRSWSNEDWAFSAGLGAKLRFSKYVSAGADYSLRAWFDSEEDSLARAYVQISF
jgi:hypothetical protein